MRRTVSRLLALGPELAGLTTFSIRSTHGQLAPMAVSSPNLDLSQLGRVALGGDFDSVSLYTYEGQNENLSSNGSQSLLTQYPNGVFESLDLVDDDTSIASMCPLVGKDGSDHGVVVGGNFTDLGGVQASSIALWNPNTTAVSPLTGLTGPVRALYCDSDSSTVYVGGDFMIGNSTNAMAWATGWVNLPFAGFNGPVNSIIKTSSGKIVFAGSFDGLGNATSTVNRDAQVVNLGGGIVSTSGTTTDAAFSDPNSIICGTSKSDTAWLLADNTPGWWEGDYQFGFIPSKLRLYNANREGRGTKTFHFERLDDGGILNLTYVDPQSGTNSSCSLDCPLPDNNGTAQDFHFVNPVGVSRFRLWITDWYGAGGGFSGIEIFQNDIYSYAVNAFNEPRCDGVSNGSISIATPNATWTRTPNRGLTEADYLTAYLTSTDQVKTDTSVVFQPTLSQSGNYSVSVYTVGCILDNSCQTRGQVNITASMTSKNSPVSTTLFQTNNYDKFDQIYYGYVDIDSGSFRPSVTLSPMSGQSVPLTVVASRVRFDLVSSTGGLNGLYEYDPSQAATTDFSTSTIDRAGSALESKAIFNTVLEYLPTKTIFAAGNFRRESAANVMSISDKAVALPGGGLNGEVMDMFLNGSMLYMGGTFSNTAQGTVTGLQNVASFSIPDNNWMALGAGVDGAVFNIVPLQLNISMNNLQSCFAVSGNFSHVNAFSGNKAYATSGFAVWVPSQNNWLHNIAGATTSLQGRFTAYTEMPMMLSPLYGGIVSSQGLSSGDVVELVGSGQPTLQSLGIQVGKVGSSSTKHKRSLTTRKSGGNYTGVYDGLFYQQNNLNITVLGGNFATTASSGSQIENLAFINNTDSNATVSGVSGLDSGSIFVAMDVSGTLLFAGGIINGTVNSNPAEGLIVFDLSLNQYASPHPAALGGENVVVNAIAAQPDSSLVFIGGNFETAGSLNCGTLCSYDVNARQWLNVGAGLSGTINSMLWSSDTQLILAGNVSINGNQTTMATYDTKKQTFQAFDGASSLPGPITAITPVDSQNNQFWVSGTATANDSVYLSKYESGTWTGAGGLGASSSIRKLQIMPLTSNHASSALMAQDQALLIMGEIVVPNDGNASAVLFNGTMYEPYILASMKDGTQGSLSAIFVSNSQGFMTDNHKHLALGLVVLIALAIALGIEAILIACGLLWERHRRRREGWVPMNVDPTTNLVRVPPEALFQNLDSTKAAPKL